MNNQYENNKLDRVCKKTSSWDKLTLVSIIVINDKSSTSLENY